MEVESYFIESEHISELNNDFLRDEKRAEAKTGSEVQPVVVGAEAEESLKTVSFNSGIIRMTKFEMLNEKLEPTALFRQGESIILRLHYQCKEPIVGDKIIPAVAIWSQGLMVTGSVSSEWGMDYHDLKGTGYFECVYPSNFFGAGDYVVSAGFVRDVVSQKTEDLCSFYWKHFKFKVVRNRLRPYNYIFEPQVLWFYYAGDGNE